MQGAEHTSRLVGYEPADSVQQTRSHRVLVVHYPVNHVYTGQDRFRVPPTVEPRARHQRRDSLHR